MNGRVVSRRALLSGWLVGLLVALGVGLVVVPGAARASAPAGEPVVNPEDWMADEAPWIHARPLNGIIIPGSHDTATYGLRDQPFDYYFAGTQDIDITRALNDGIRFFDLRVKYKDWGGSAGPDYWGFHNNSVSNNLRFSQMLEQVARWATAPGHERELILLNLTINTDGAAFPNRACEEFRRALGSQLLQPTALERLGVRDPYQATFGQLWSLPGHPHVMSDSAQCTGEAWPGADAAQEGSPFGSYYASQCYAAPYAGGRPGVSSEVLGALSERAKVSTEGNGGAANEYLRNRPLRSGFYVSYLQSTTTWQCAFLSLHDYTVPATRDTLAAIYDRFLRNDGNARRYGNILAGDFVEQTSLVADAIAMNKLWPLEPNTLSLVDGNGQVGPIGQPLPLPLSVRLTYDGKPIPRHEVNFDITSRNAKFGASGFVFTVRAYSDDNGVATSPPVVAGPFPGAVTITADAGRDSPPGSFTEHIGAATDRVLTLISPASVTGTVGTVIPAGAFAARVTSPAGALAANEPVRFDPLTSVPPAGVFAGSPSPDVTTVNTDAAGIARSPALTAGTTAGWASVAIAPPPQSMLRVVLKVPVFLQPDRPVAVSPLLGADQSAGISSAFVQRLTATVTDRYGNGVPDARVELTANGGAKWGSGPFVGPNTIAVFSNVLGVLQPPVLYAGPRPREVTIDARITDPAARVVNPPFVFAGRRTSAVTIHARITGPAAGPVLFRLPVVPGPPAAATDTRGNRQYAATGHAFAARLVATVRDRDGDRESAGVPVTFTVVRGRADFPAAPDEQALRAVDGRALAVRADIPHASVTVPTDQHGRATAPPLTAYRDGPVRITASVEGAHRVANWTLHAIHVAVLGLG